MARTLVLKSTLHRHWPPSMESMRIVILEDELIVVRDLSKRLQQMGYEVVAHFAEGAPFIDFVKKIIFKLNYRIIFLVFFAHKSIHLINAENGLNPPFYKANKDTKPLPKM